MSQSPGARQQLIDRLASYWKMEAGTAVMIPAVMIWLNEGRLGPASYAAMVPMILLLAIGGAYWRTKYLRLTTVGHDSLPLLRLLLRVRPYILALIIAALGGTVLVWLQPHLSSGLGDRITASVASALAVAEYINYYHRQLQHFDNMADFKRLLSGKGFRRSQMAVDLDAVAGKPRSSGNYAKR